MAESDILELDGRRTRLKKWLESRLLFRCRMRRTFVSVALMVVLISIFVTVSVTHAQALTWAEVTNPADMPFHSLFCVSANDCWAVGGNPGPGTIIHWVGSFWSTVPSPTTGEGLRSVFCVRANDCWAAGDEGMTLHWAGSSWSTVTSPTTTTPSTTDLSSVFCVSANDCWAAGGTGYGSIIHWNGSSWSRVTSPNDIPLNSVFCVGANDCWAVGGSIGAKGTILHWAGSSWGTVTSPTNRGFHSVFCVSANDCWAVGEEMVHWAGLSWSPVTSPTNDPLYSVFCVSTNDCWALGLNGAIIHGRASSVLGGSSGAHYTRAGVVAAILLVAVAFLIVRKRMVRPDLPSKPSHAAAHPVRFCMSCGKKISEGERFCTKCGTKQQ